MKIKKSFLKWSVVAVGLATILVVATETRAEQFQEIATESSGVMFQFDNGAGAEHLYPETGIVTEIEISGEETVLTITCANGNSFKCTTADCDWYVNDLASMLMDSKGTELVYDDEVLDCKYAGALEHFMNFMEEDK